jgi:phosphoribosylformylglycinamidine synthase
MFRVSFGHSAHSKFRFDKLVAAVQSVAPNVSKLSTRHCYFIDLKSKLSDERNALLDRLLNLDGEAGEPKDAQKLQQILVVPRVGTISPWSSKGETN